MLRYSLNRLTGIGEYIFQPSDNPDNGNQFESSDQQDYLAVNVYDTVTIENSLINIFTPPSGYYDLPNYTKGRLASTAFRTRQSDNWSYKYYRYDERGRVKTMWLIIDGLEVKTVSYEYNSQDQITALIYDSGIDFKKYRYRYDNAARLQAVETYDGPEPSDDPLYYQSFADYEYNPNSFIVTQNFLGGFTGSSLGYDNRGRKTSSYAHNSEFIYNLTYLRNSNVLQQELYGSYRDNFANTEDLVYKFTYDKSNRLLSATNTAGSSNEYKIENTYDKDGNILTMKRYVDAGVIQDDFTYQYYSGTNKLSRVSGNVDQFRYDLNGNVTTDSVYNNFSISYDHRNLITELYHIDTLTSTRQYSYATRYWYDEAGNRVRKLTYRNAQIPPPLITDWSNPGNGWTFLNNEHYIRGVDGKELATYSGNTLTEWYIWGNDIVGKIKGSTKYYFFKDHLGSVRAVVNNNFNLVSAVDYDMWGDKMQGRIYNGDSTKFGFTGKEEDEENLYVYFGARYYDSRIGRWGQVEPQLSNVPSYTPYNYASDCPISRLDPNGLDDYYFTRGSTMETTSRIPNTVDRYFIQHEAGNITSDISGPNSPNELEGLKFYETASDKTMEIYFESAQVFDPSDVYVDFQGSTFHSMYEASLPHSKDTRSSFDFALDESPRGVMDQKKYLSKYGLYIFGNKANDYRETGNIIWGSTMYHLGFSLLEARAVAHIFTLYTYRQFDQKNEQQAIFTGYEYASQNRFSKRLTLTT